MADLPFDVGDVIFVPQYHRAYRPYDITLRVTRIRNDLPVLYDVWQWVEGYEIGADGARGSWTQVLARLVAVTVVERGEVDDADVVVPLPERPASVVSPAR